MRKKKRNNTRGKSGFTSPIIHSLGEKKTRQRYGIFFLFLVCGGLMIYRLYMLQVVQGDVYRSQVDRQHNNIYSNDDFVRGDIYFTYHNGNRLLAATNKEYYSLVINNRNIKDHTKVQHSLAQVVDFSAQRFAEIVKKENDPYEVLLKKIPDDAVEGIRGLGLRGVELHVKEERYYPLGNLASTIVGFVSFQDDQWRGTYGLEKYYDNILRRDGQTVSKTIFSSLFSGDHSTENDESSIDKHIAKEGSLVTTIEPHMQDFLQRTLGKNEKDFRSQYSAGIIMDANSGAIVAMVSGNEFDINTHSEHYRNRLVEDRYEFGSVMKPLTVAMALDSGAISPNFSYNDTGSMSMNQYTFYNYDKRGRGAYTTLQTILTQSLNTGVATIALNMGFDIFEEYLSRLGLDSETGIDLPFEVYGITSNLDSRRNVELATASFGQGVAFTAIEIVHAWSALANDGVPLTPYVVDTLEYGDLIPAKNVPAGLYQQVFESPSVDQVTDYLVAIVDDSDTFSPYALPQHSVALKTGTAQMVKPGGGYYEKQFLHSMVGYFPAYAEQGTDQFVIMLYTVKPQGARFSSTTLKDPFFETVRHMINYYDIRPDRNLSSLDNIQ